MGGGLVGVWEFGGWCEVNRRRTISILAHRVFTTLVERFTRAERQMAAIMPREPDARTAPMASFLLDSM